MAVREGSVDAPTRHPLDWRNPEFYAEEPLNAELERIFDICHGCRRCVSLCNAFPTLFDLVDNSKTMEVDGVAKEDYWKVIDQCYLCDLCYMTKCPYVPPHPWNVDFPHLMLRAKARKFREKGARFRDRMLTSTDAMGKLASIPVVVNMVNAVNANPGARKVMEKVLGVAAEARLPAYDSARLRDTAPASLAWPVRNGATPKRLYLQANSKASFTPPSGEGSTAADAFVSDPATPVPYRPRPIRPTYGEGSTWSRWLADDQRFLKGRKDVVSWETDPLTDDVVIAGDIAAHLFASTTGSDADWVVKLIDVYPDSYDPAKMAGYQFMVANDVLRGRFRKGFENPEPITPNHVDEYVVDLHTQDYKFKKGHRIMVQVQSSWFPLIDRNPQTFMPNIFAAKDADFKAQTHRVFRSRDAASYVQLPIVTANAK